MSDRTPASYSVAARLCLIALLLASCAPPPRPRSPFADPRFQREKPLAYTPEGDFSYWDDPGGEGRIRVKIDLSDQAAYIYRGQQEIGRARVATGLYTHPTPRGSFKIIEKEPEKRSTLYGEILDKNDMVVKRDGDSRYDTIPPGGRFIGARMPYWMRLTSTGIGMHVGPIPTPGLPASHGCIRMRKKVAVPLYRVAPLGTPVEIVD